MNYLKLSFAFFILCFSISISASAQQDTAILSNILNKSKIIAERYPAEKVYLHFDKPYYSVADTMYFKAYLTFEQNVPSPLSKVVYVDLINSQDSIVKSLKLPVTNSVAYGSLDLDMVNIKQDNYHVRAYTVWMFNAGPEYFFTKNIPIGEAIDKKVITHISYNNTQTDKSQVINAKIQFKNLDKIPVAGKAVNWSVTSNYEVVSRGKGVTDQSGILKLSISPRKNEPITTGNLVTEVNMGPQDPPVTASFVLKPVVGNNDIQFFPEGGELVKGVPTQIGFKAINQKGLGIELTGVLTDNDGNQITTFSSTHLGMGSFYLNAEGSKTYKANITFKDGTKKTFNLPKSVESGMSIQVNATNPDVVNFKIVANDAYFQQNQGKSISIVAQNGGRVYYAAQSKLSTQVTAAKIPADKFPSGIIQMTLFGADGQPVSERMFFVLRKDGMNLSLKSDLPAYKPRQKVRMTISAKDSTTRLVGDFSLSVTDLQKVPVDENTETTILSSLLLTSDLQGYVERPNYYFIKTDEKKRQELDVLMLTQAYRRFSYKEILANKFPVTNFMPEEGITFTGTLRDRTGMPLKKAGLRLTSPGRTLSSQALTTNMGVFTFKNLVFEDGAELVINANYGAGNNNMIMLDAPFIPEITKNPAAAVEQVNIDSTLSSYLDNSKKQYSNLRTLKEVKITGATVKKPSHADHIALTGLSMMADHTVAGERLQDCNDLLMCLKTFATGMTFDTDKFYVSRSYNQGDRTPAQIFINGNAVDAISVNSVMPKDVESVEIFTQDQLGLVFKQYQCNGVIVINTKKVEKSNMTLADLKKMMPQNNILKFTPKGYTRAKDFYSPKYTTQTSSYTGNDLRTTIYWNPKIVTNAAGDTVVEFYNSDGKGTYRAVIEGVDINGNVGRFVYRYTVK
ncbi:carboxypeptidase regulatory-like domain-containing protein [Pedobacter sp. MC2016-15]|uniref:carboxypeptidase regulatory-like domain-containing protein n=1 Tax=Pedobacter sp. MC2016-15 TaxID=2994473 RepID=UPI0022471BA3|nr:carboxypeptidase regulatory-like domain-containing protein [Pedobacter sp. MC2016-15]MCX2478871.1 carboxypeptidase regulatory-like domain-containing protein [Pedobacter sp. MC2016-15]